MIRSPLSPRLVREYDFGARSSARAFSGSIFPAGAIAQIDVAALLSSPMSFSKRAKAIGLNKPDRLRP
jgi:hypothetical protein